MKSIKGLTLTALKYLCKTVETKDFFQSEIIINASQLFPLHLNTYVMGLRPYYNYFSAGTVFRRQNMESLGRFIWKGSEVIGI